MPLSHAAERGRVAFVFHVPVVGIELPVKGAPAFQDERKGWIEPAADFEARAQLPVIEVDIAQRWICNILAARRQS